MKNKSPQKNNLKLGIALMVLCTLFTAFGQLFYKYGSETFSFTLQGILTNHFLFLGFFFYGVGAIILMMALKYGNLSLLYPFVSLNFIWVTLLSVFKLNEHINSFKINAIILVILGVFFIGGSGG